MRECWINEVSGEGMSDKPGVAEMGNFEITATPEIRCDDATMFQRVYKQESMIL